MSLRTGTSDRNLCCTPGERGRMRNRPTSTLPTRPGFGRNEVPCRHEVGFAKCFDSKSAFREIMSRREGLDIVIVKHNL
eukprot:9503249-Pyramimonas_sp.AAC.1